MNNYEIKDDITVLFVDHKGQALEYIIDTSDLAILIDYGRTWSVLCDSKGNPAYLKHSNCKRPSTLLHRFLTGVTESGVLVDHISGDKFDNRRCNLRIANKSENGQNRAGAQANNKSSGVRGVYPIKKTGKWKAQVMINRKSIHLGTFLTIEEAEAAVKKARAELMPYSKESNFI
jgi:hypothetical protein